MVVVVGMGRSGLAASRLLTSRGIDVFVSDANPDPPMRAEFDRLGLASETGGHSIEKFTAAEEIVVSPGVPLGIEALARARENGIRIVSELELASRYLLGDIVAVTGSNGKTTTVSLAEAILESGSRPVQVGGNIGVAASELVASATEDTINVLEVSSFQLDAIAEFRPHVGVLLNITPDHLDRYRDFPSYRMSKFNLFRNQREEDFAVINRDDAESFPPPVPITARGRFFSRRDSLGAAGGVLGGFLTIRGHRVIAVSELPLRGAHNVENVLAAILIADAYGITPGQMAPAIRNFKGVEHRLEPVATIDGVQFVNDSKATNVDSAIKAVQAFDGNIVLILGGKDKGGSFAPLVDAIEGRVREVLTLGAAAGMIEQAIGTRAPTLRVRTMEEAIARALETARDGDVVLLAPACASLDMYANYEERGRHFKEVVRAHMKVAK